METLINLSAILLTVNLSIFFLKKTVDKFSTIAGTTDSTENIGDQSENDETDWIAQSRSSDDPGQVTFHSDSEESASADNVIGRQNNSFENFFEVSVWR